MRILHLVPGTGNFYSGVCLRDHALARELRAVGHEVEMVPLYLPLILDHPEPNLRPLQIGGVDLYFQQHSALFRRLPRWSQQLLDTKPILRAASACMAMTRARDLGVMTVGSFECLDGPQRQGWRSLLDDLKREPRPDVISISLGLLAGLGRFIKEEIGLVEWWFRCRAKTCFSITCRNRGASRLGDIWRVQKRMSISSSRRVSFMPRGCNHGSASPWERLRWSTMARATPRFRQRKQTILRPLDSSRASVTERGWIFW